MTAPFDPYFELLGIDQSNRPPDHYALLGLELYESSAEKIDEAATDRMSRLQDLANSELMDHSQRLLNELSAARRCLLSPVRKVAYDEALRTKRQRARPSSGLTPQQEKKQQTRRMLIFIGVGLLGLMILAAFVFLPPGAPKVTPNLLVDWPLSERAGGSIQIDSKPIPLSEKEPMELLVPTGRHVILFQRTGFRDITQTIEFTPTPMKLKLRWIPDNN